MKESIITKLLDSVDMEEYLTEKDDAYIEASMLCARYEEQLKNNINEEDKQLLEKYTGSIYKCWDIDQQSYFRDGFIIGARIMLEVLGKDIEENK